MTRITGPSAVHLILFNDLDQLLMIERHYLTAFHKVMTIPAGHIEAGEHPLEAMAREASEELGIDIAEKDLQFSCVMHRATPKQVTNYF